MVTLSEPAPPLTAKPTPQVTAAQKRFGEHVGRFVGILIIVLIPFFSFVWGQIDGLPYQLAALFGLVGLIAIIFISYVARTAPVFAGIRNLVVVFVITFGAAGVALLFNNAARDEVFKLFVVVYFSLLPAFLYLQFMTIRGRTLWEEFVDNLFRLEADADASLPRPPPHSRFHQRWLRAQAINPVGNSTRTLYQQKFEGVFGGIPTADIEEEPSFPKDKLAPVILATVLLSVGWVLVVMPASIFDLWSSAREAPDSPELPLNTVRFGFLGAYFYAVQMLVRRYFQNDLKASAFYNVVMRIVVVALLTWVLDLALADATPTATEPAVVDSTRSARAVIAFIVGVFPDVGWKALQATIKIPLRSVVPSLRQQYPLSDLDGLNVWYEARLLEEGVEDMQNLATCSLVDVMLNTRIPVDRLVDWVDQSLLFLHLGKDATVRDQLRRYGIRTATDLEDAFVIAPNPTDAQVRHIEALSRVLNTDDKEPSVLVAVLATLRCEPNFHHVSAWRREHAEPRPS